MQVVSCCGPKGLFFEGCYGSPDRVQCRLLDAEHHLGAVVAAPEWLKVDGFFFIGVSLELVSKELNHFGVIAGLFRQIGSHSSRFVLFSSF